LKHVDKIFCINLDSRPDRWEESKQEFKKLGIDNDVERISAANIQPGIIGCTKSHYECIKLAKNRNYNNVLILEDDVRFVSDTMDILNASLTQISNRDIKFDILYLGANLRGTDNRLIDTNLASITSAKATHAYIINSAVYDIILNTYENCQWIDGPNWRYSNPNRLNIDVFYMHTIQPRGNTYGVYPCIADQRSGYSDLIHSDCYYGLAAAYDKILNDTSI